MEQRRSLILASGSPRRRDLLDQLGFRFEVSPTDVEEVLPKGVPNDGAALYLAELKARAGYRLMKHGAILLAADTTVLLDEELINKPTDAADAERMLAKLCGRTQRVITGVAIAVMDERKPVQIQSFQVETAVTLLVASAEEIETYVRRQQPLDKAGAYGIQDWLGWAKCSRIEGSYSNVMGLPTAEVFAALTALGAPYEL